MMTLQERAAALRHDLLHSPAGWDQIIDRYSRALVKAAVKLIDESEGDVDFAKFKIRRELLGE